VKRESLTSYQNSLVASNRAADTKNSRDQNRAAFRRLLGWAFWASPELNQANIAANHCVALRIKPD